MHTKSLVVLAALTIHGGVVPLPAAQRPAQNVDRGMDVRELLVAARGVPPAVCVLAADGASNGWGGGWDAPDLAIRSDVRRMVRNLRDVEMDDAQGRALIDALAS